MFGRSIRRALVAVAALSLLASEPRSQEAPPQNQNGRNHREPSAGTPHDHSRPPLAVVASSEVRTLEQTKSAGNEETDWWHAFFYDIKITDVLLALFTLALVYYTRGLDRSTERLWEDSKKQIAAAQSAANAAAVSNRITRELFIAEQRPWIFIDTTEHGKPRFDEEGRLWVTLKFIVKNIGKSPAFSAASCTTGSIHVGYDTYESYFNGIREITEGHVSFKGKTIFPGEDHSFENEIVVTQEQIDITNTAERAGSQQFIAISYKYKNSSGDMLETSRIWYFGVEYFNSPLPRNKEELADKAVDTHLFTEVIV